MGCCNSVFTTISNITASFGDEKYQKNFLEWHNMISTYLSKIKVPFKHKTKKETPI